MNRRQFFKRGLTAGAALAALPPKAGTGADIEPTCLKVREVMLSMQRHAWEQGVAAQALLERGDKELVILLAREAVLRQWDDGRLGQICDNHGVTDPAANGEAVLFAARATGDPRLKAAADKMLDYLVRVAPRTKDGVLHHIDHKPQAWVDSLYMAPPFLAVAGRPDEAMRQIEGFRRLLWNAEAKLFSHIWDDGRGAFEREAFWGVGNGWAAAGMTRVAAALPPAMAEEKRRLTGFIKEVVDGCLARQRPDALFHDVVDDPRSFVETNLAQMLAYTIYRGVKTGWLDPSYRPRADRMRAAAEAKVDERGYVRDVCGSPTFEAPGVATEGQAFFLLMEAAARA
ncbi:MAG: glycoside hydrolase family 88 protein [Candidatus Aminicenantes bacterium]|nr:glycoside hydrolase family 88 protein [Candidatus Aminicenantes bacterium]